MSICEMDKGLNCVETLPIGVMCFFGYIHKGWKFCNLMVHPTSALQFMTVEEQLIINELLNLGWRYNLMDGDNFRLWSPNWRLVICYDDGLALYKARLSKEKNQSLTWYAATHDSRQCYTVSTLMPDEWSSFVISDQACIRWLKEWIEDNKGW